MPARIPLPNGSIYRVASTFSTAKTITAITNASPAVVTSAAHGLSNGDFVLITSGWGKLDGRAARVAGVTTDTFQLEAVDTSNLNFYPAGAGVGSINKVITTVEVTKILGFTTSGGEQQFVTVGYLAEDDDRQFPSNRNPMNLQLTVQDEPTASYVPVVEGYGDSKIGTVGILTLASGGQILHPGFISITQNPTMERNQVMSRAISLSLSSKPTRYVA